MFTLEVYGVKDILGIQYGFKGFVDKNYPPVKVCSMANIKVELQLKVLNSSKSL